MRHAHQYSIIAIAAALMVIIPTAVNATVDCSKLPPGTACLPGSQQMAPSAKTPSGISKKAIQKACPRGWKWSPMKNRCINIGEGGSLR